MVGLEPTRGHPRKILSLVRLPFRHIRSSDLKSSSCSLFKPELILSHPNHFCNTLYQFFSNFKAIEGCKVVGRGLCTADQFHASVLFQQQFRGFELSVIVIPHGKSVCPGVVDDQIISGLHLRQHPVDGKFIVIFT